MMMKYALAAILALCSTQLFASSDEGKHYCSADNVEIHDSVILVQVENEVFETDALLADQGGVYVLDSGLRCPECRKTLNPKNTCEYRGCHS